MRAFKNGQAIDPVMSGAERTRGSARRDIALIVLISVSAALLCIQFDASEALLGWTRLHERLQLDELPAVLLVLAICLIWFSSRRYFDAQRQLKLRTATEGRLAEALAENQRLAQQYVDLQEYERKALARDLHDELGQYLNVIKLDAVSIRDASPAGDAPAAASARAMIDNIDRVYGVVGTLIRRLRPVGFDDLGLAAALEHCIGDWRSRLAATIHLDIGTRLDGLDETRALALFRLVQEALTNVARHSRAARVDIRIGAAQTAVDPSRVVEVSIVDDGVGSDLTVPRSGLGLVGMRERVAAFGGSLVLRSAPGAGFTIVARVPLADFARVPLADASATKADE